MRCPSLVAKLPCVIRYRPRRSWEEKLRMVSPEALKLNEILRNAPKAVDMDLAHQREAGEHAEDMTSEPEGVRYEDAPRWKACGPRLNTGTASLRLCTST